MKPASYIIIVYELSITTTTTTITTVIIKQTRESKKKRERFRQLSRQYNWQIIGQDFSFFIF
mgnify:CR=1 FL=1